MQKRLTIVDLHRDINERLTKKTESYQKMYDKVEKKIQHYARKNSTSCCFEIPEYILGYPLFDLHTCIQFLYTELTKNGFLVTYIFPNYLYISWDFSEISVQNTKQPEQFQIPQYKQLPIPKLALNTQVPIYTPIEKYEMDHQKMIKDEEVKRENVANVQRVDKLGFNGNMLPFLSSSISSKKNKDFLFRKSGGVELKL